MNREKIQDFLRDEDNILKMDISYRGGILKYNISKLLSDDSLEAIDEVGEVAEAGAYQNYLGGGIAGKISVGVSFDRDLLTDEDKEIFDIFCDEVVSFFFEINNGGDDDYMQENYGTLDHNQNLPESAY